MRTASLLSSSALLAAVWASPTPVKHEARANGIPSQITSAPQFDSVVSGLLADASELALGASVIVDLLAAIIPGPTPASIAAEISSVAAAYSAHPTTFLESVFDLIEGSLVPTDLVDVVLGDSPFENSSNNINPPVAGIFPKKSQNDAPYSVSESSLRGAIYIPPGFTYGKVRPLILIPGTGVTGGENFAPNFGKLFAGSSYADPVYLNIPGNQLNDIQVNSEYVAYAINYISTLIGGKNVSALSWSQGSVDAGWAFQYWPSTRNVVSDLINISGDYHGTVLAYLICPGFPQIPCAPSIIQQEYNSTFIQTLRNGGGSSAYVPTTTVYSIFDEIVQPQEGTGASSYLLDARGVGVSNTELQSVCPAQPAGTLYSHEGVLYNSVAVALAVDALTHDGPADINRLDLGTLCQEVAANGLSLTDVLATEGTIPIALINILEYSGKTTTEPAIMSYAQKDTPRK